MTVAEAARPALRTDVGHHLEKGAGKTVYEGPLVNLPDLGRLSAEEATARMFSDGYVVFPGALDRDEAAELRAIMDEKGGPDDSKWDVPHWCYNRHQGTDYWQDPRLLTYIDRPGVIDVVQAIHDPGAHVTGGSFWTTGHGRAMGIHIDYLPISLPESVHDDPRIQVPIFTSTVHFYLNDIALDLGPTTLIPGSHRAGRPPVDETTWHEIAPQAAMVRAGDAVLFRGDIWHGAAMHTRRAERRYIMQVHYGNQIVRKEYPPMRHESLWNPEVVAQATPRQRQLLGGDR